HSLIGCSIWPASLFLSAFILSFPDMFSPKTCFTKLSKVGSGVGFVGVCLSHVILSDGDLSALSNMKLNLKMNQFSMEDDEPVSSESAGSVSPSEQYSSSAIMWILMHFDHAQIGGITEIDIISSPQVKCLHLPWECASESELQGLKMDSSSRFPRAACDGAIDGSHNYSDNCKSQDFEAACNNARNASPTKHPFAYISSVICNANTFDCFLALADEANLAIADLTRTLQPPSLLPYMQSFNRSSIQLFRLLSK
ncbi:hypothetical protein ACJRO7_032922, partial [Eucalyptus globulus]